MFKVGEIFLESNNALDFSTTLLLTFVECSFDLMMLSPPTIFLTNH